MLKIDKNSETTIKAPSNILIEVTHFEEDKDIAIKLTKNIVKSYNNQEDIIKSINYIKKQVQILQQTHNAVDDNLIINVCNIENELNEIIGKVK